MLKNNFLVAPFFPKVVIRIILYRILSYRVVRIVSYRLLSYRLQFGLQPRWPQTMFLIGNENIA